MGIGIQSDGSVLETTVSVKSGRKKLYDNQATVVEGFSEKHIKVDLVDELGTQVRELEEKLNETTESSIHMSGELEELKRDAIIREHSRDLAETQVEKLKTLAEDVDFEDEETFAQKVSTIKESYFTKKTPSVVGEDVIEDVEEEEVSESMSRYVTAIQRTAKQ